MAEAAPLGEGAVVADRYRVTGILGAGATGTVYAVEHVTLSRPLAMKVLHPHVAGASDLTQRFEREAQAIARLDHPNVVGVVDFGQAPGVGWYLVTERVQGAPLSQALAARPDWVGPAFDQLLDAVAHAHEQGILHRDLKPDNVLVGERAGAPLVKVLDFGLAKVLQEGGEVLTQQGAVFGTPRYMSPEQAGGEPAGPASDQYAVGVMLYEVLEGKPPFDGGSVAEILTKHITQDLPAPKASSAAMRAILARALDKDPSARFESTATFRAALVEAAQHVGAAPEVAPPGALDDTALSAPERPSAPSASVSPPRGRRPARLGAVVGLVSCLGLGFALFGGEDTRLEQARAHLAAGRLDAASASLDAVLAEAPESGAAHLLKGHVAAAREGWEDAAEAYQAALTFDPGLAEDPRLGASVQQILQKRRKRGHELTLWLAQRGDGAAADLLQTIATEAPRPSTRRAAYEGLERLGEEGRLERARYLEAELKRVRSQGCKVRRWYVERLLALDDEAAHEAARREVRRKDPLLGLIPQSGCMQGLLRDGSGE